MNQNTDSKSEVSSKDTVNKEELKAKIVSIEVVGTETAPRRKHSKKFESWNTIAVLSFFVLIGSLAYSAFDGLSMGCLTTTVVSYAVFFYSFGQLDLIDWDERTGRTR